jgi:acetoin utilization deacetylase AcuC-like enzyme
VKLVVNDPLGDDVHLDPGHPERPERSAAARDGIAELALGADEVRVSERRATRVELARVHEGSYLDQLGAFCYEGGGNLDPDTYATYDSYDLAQRCAGAGLAVVDELRRRAEGVGFVVARPPGHHALRDRAMGFCLLNNVAVAAAALSSAGERVLILDWDVHHGNGTQEIFWDDASVLYVSTHQWPLYPGTGGTQEVGGLHAAGLTVNLPLPPAATGDVVRAALEEIAAPVVEAFTPTFVLVSAGYDAHRDDPLADLRLSSGDFASLAAWVAQYAGPGRLALFLEGGYDLAALRGSVAATLAALVDAPHTPESRTHGGPGRERLARVRDERASALEQIFMNAQEEER